jgi:hypothetical protein
MRAGALLRLDRDVPIAQLDGLRWIRREGEHNLTSVIQFGDEVALDENRAQIASVIHQYVGDESTLTHANGVYSVRSTSVVRTYQSDIHVLLEGFQPDHCRYVVVDRVENRQPLFDVITKGLRITEDKAGPVSLNTIQASADHPRQWVHAYSRRRGRSDRGVVFGTDVKSDPEVGAVLQGEREIGSIGWTTSAFGDPTKVRIGPSGSVLVLANPDDDEFLEFIVHEVLPYVV